jgi:Tfp pilus assembly protein PilF
MTAGEFTRRLKKMCEHPDSRFAFFLGAGCSVSSGIPDAARLVRQHWLPRLRDLRDPSRKDVDKWAAETFSGYEPANAAAFYGEVMEELFLLPEERQREIELLCESRFPGFGYAALASLMTLPEGRFNVALTTNFDDLLADAFFMFTKARPLVTPHESLGNYLRPTRTRPLIVKLHGDHRLAPLNTLRATDDIRKDVEKRVRSVIRDRGLIFMGYGGNDESIVQLLSEFTEEALPLGVYWFGAEPPAGPLRAWLESRQTVWVDEADFDESMLLLRDIFAAPHPESKRFDHVFAKYTATYQALSTRVGQMAENRPNAATLKEAVKHTDGSFPDWWSVEMETERLKQTDPLKADAVYAKGIEQFPNSSELLGSYANFLRDVRKDNVRAEDLYQRAVALDGNNVELLQNYAFFLARIRKDFDKAEEFYSHALSLEPGNARLVATFASFLAKMRKDPKRAEECYRRALAMDEADPYLLASHAGFLLAQGRDEEGMSLLTRLAAQAGSEETPNLTLETGFYLLAHGPAENRAQTLSQLKRALKTGRRRQGLILSPNIVKARQSGHPDSTWLEKLATVITDEANISILDDWAAWKSA